MIGLRFKISNEWDKVLSKILHNIASFNDCWKVSNEEVYKENMINLFEKEIYTSNEFNKIITKEKYYPVFLTLQLYNLKSKLNDIKNYDDYINSDCKLLLIIVDNIFVDVFSKDENILNQIKQNAKDNNFSNIVSISNKDEFCLYF